MFHIYIDKFNWYDMKSIGIFYGSTTGVTEGIASKIASVMNVDYSDVHDVSETDPSVLGGYDMLVLGTSTYGEGDLQDDWYDFISGAESLDLKDKKIALFGCGDESMTMSFCGAVGVIYSRMQTTGARFIGEFSAECYDFEESDACHDGKMAVGLLLDEVNHPELTDERISKWVETLK